MPKKPTQSKPSRAKQGRGEGLLSTALLALLEATAYDLWMSALTSTSPRGMELYQRMKNPEIGDQVMEITTYRRITKNRRGFGKLIEKTGNNHELETMWTIETPDGQTCDWRNALMIAIPAGSFEWYPSLANVKCGGTAAQDSQSEANEGAYPPLPPTTCSASSDSLSPSENP